MRDKSKKLTVVNTGKKKVDTQNLIEKQSSSRPSVLPSIIGMAGAEYLLKSIWDSVFEIKTDGNGQKYIYGKLPVVTQYGVTMYADNGNLNIPSIYDGLPIDNTTLVWKEGVLMVNPDIELGGASSWDELEGIPSWIGETKPTYEYSEIKNTPDLSKYVSSDDLSKYVTLGTEQPITGKKNFTTGGLFVNGKQIQYDATNGCWKLEGNLLVTGGVTMYADGTTSGGSSAYSTLGSLLNVDDSIDASASVDRVLFQAAGSSEWVTKPLSEIGGSVSGDYLPLIGGTITGNINFSTSDIGITLGGSSILTVSSTLAGNQNSTTTIFGINRFPTTIRSNADNLYHYNSSEGSLYKILTSGNYSSYALPLSGGTISGKLTVDTALDYPFTIHRSSDAASYVAFENSNGYLGDVGFFKDGRLYAFVNGVNETLWHSGNDGSGSGLDADLLDGMQPNALSVLSASKLTTARTIWGQSFDGSGNVNGNLQFSGNYTIQNSSGNNVFHAYNSFTIVGYDNCPNQKSTYIDGYAVYLRYGSSWANGFVLNSVGDVGIGTDSPLCKLDVRGVTMCQYMRFNSYTDASMQIGYIGRGSGAVDDLILYAENGKLRFYTNGNATNPMTFEKQNLTVPGGITMYSDQRKKTILNHVELSLKQIADAPLIEHYYNSDQEKTTHVGSIAQYWAGLNDWFCKKDEEGFYTMEIQNAALASAISIARHLERYESKTDKKIRQLKKRISQLEDELEKLKAA